MNAVVADVNNSEAMDAEHLSKIYAAKPIPIIIPIPGQDVNGIECVGFLAGKNTAVFVPKDDLDNGVIQKDEVWRYVADLAYANNDIDLDDFDYEAVLHRYAD